MEANIVKFFKHASNFLKIKSAKMNKKCERFQATEFNKKHSNISAFSSQV